MNKFDIDHLYLTISPKKFERLVEYNKELNLFYHNIVQADHDSWEGLYFRFTNGFYIEIITPGKDRPAGKIGLAFSNFKKLNKLNIDKDNFEFFPMKRGDGSRWFDAYWLKNWSSKKIDIWGMEYHPPLVSKKKNLHFDIGELISIDVYLKESTFDKLCSLSEDQFPFKKRLGKDSLYMYSSNNDMKIKFLRSRQNKMVIKFIDNKKRVYFANKDISYKKNKYSELVISC
ncbi:MAG: hypothetical protein CMK92_06550 [Pseudomonas sp.]|nr:hypothetical protein [Pseudomonas sp.]